MTSDVIADPETDPTATYAVDPGLARRLTVRVVCSPRARTALTRTPMTGAPLASLPESAPADVTAAYAAARAAQRLWSRIPMGRRARIFLRFHDLVLARQVQLLDLIRLESGKARLHAFEEVADTTIVSRHYARHAAGYLRPRRRQGAFPLFSQAFELRHPKGVVGIVAPWNYPLSMSITDAIPAMLGGNAVVLRPDNCSALTALAAVALLDEAGLPDGVLQVVLGDGPTVGQRRARAGGLRVFHRVHRYRAFGGPEGRPASCRCLARARGQDRHIRRTRRKCGQGRGRGGTCVLLIGRPALCLDRAALPA
jgi:succinate-semialdehyde dehydrogenase / glutarate-semialdehyde dehydrogenase